MRDFFHNALQPSYLDPAQWKDGPQTSKSVCSDVCPSFFFAQNLSFLSPFFFKEKD